MMRSIYRNCLIVSILTAILIIIVSGILYINNNLPDTIFVNSNQSTKYNFSIPVSLDVDHKNKIHLTGKNDIQSGNVGDYQGTYKLFGIIALKNTKVKVIEKKYAYPIGLPVGLYLKTQGVMVIQVGEITDYNGNTSSPAEGKVNPGEYIVKFNDIRVSNKSQLSYLINENGSKEVCLTLKSGNTFKTVNIKPVKNQSDAYMLGIWVRDDSQGIGTMTFITENNQYAALGHGISDVDTGKLLSSHDGIIYKANIWGIKKGEKGKPGGLCGTIIYNDSNIIGSIYENNNSGLFGSVNTNIYEKYHLKKMEVGLHSDVQTGKAKIQFIYEGKVQQYDINILEINKNNKEKNMVIEITDKKLLEKTNGIVQGMSGCPIIQNEKIVGAVTHVMVDEPTKGYAILTENMLEYIKE